MTDGSAAGGLTDLSTDRSAANGSAAGGRTDLSAIAVVACLMKTKTEKAKKEKAMKKEKTKKEKEKG